MKKLFLGMLALAGAALVATSCTKDTGGEILPTSVKLSQVNKTMEPNETLQLDATILPAEAKDRSVTWTSDAPAIASVNNNGLVTAVAEGSATITATTVNNLTATCSITVSKNVIHVTKVTIAAADPAASTALTEGAKFQLKATVEPDTATDKVVLWSSSDEKVATVDENGLVTAAAQVPGDGSSVTITARANDDETITDTFALTVKHTNVYPTGINILDSAPMDFVLDAEDVDYSKPLPGVRFTPENPDNKGVQWVLQAGDARGNRPDPNDAFDALSRTGYVFPLRPGSFRMYAGAMAPISAAETTKPDNEKVFAYSPVEENISVNVSVTGVSGVSMHTDETMSGAYEGHTHANILNPGRERVLYARSFLNVKAKVPSQNVADPAGSLVDRLYSINSNDDVQQTTAWEIVATYDEIPAELKPQEGVPSNLLSPANYDKDAATFVASGNKATITAATAKTGKWCLVKATNKGKAAYGVIHVDWSVENIEFYDDADNRKLESISGTGGPVVATLNAKTKTSIDLRAQILPSEITSSLIYTSSDKTILVLDAPDEMPTSQLVYMATSTDGKMTVKLPAAPKAGQTSIQARMPDNMGALSRNITILVEVPPTTISMPAATGGNLQVSIAGGVYTPVWQVEPATATQSLSFKSSNTAVATVDATTGAITPLSAGTATITATSTVDATTTGTVNLTVVDKIAVTAITKSTYFDGFSDGTYDMVFARPGNTTSYTVNVMNGTTPLTSASPSGTGISAFKNNVTVGIAGTANIAGFVEPSGATDKTMSYTSSDPDIIAVNATSGALTLTGKTKPGEVTITATSNSNPEVKQTWKFRVLPAVASVQFGNDASSQLPARAAADATKGWNTPASRIEMNVGDELTVSQLGTVTVLPAEALQLIYMTSSAPLVAAFDSTTQSATRKLTALAPGVAVITALPLAQAAPTMNKPIGRLYVVVKPQPAATFLGTASFASATEVTVDGLTWSDAVRVSNARGKQGMPNFGGTADPYTPTTSGGGNGAGYEFREIEGGIKDLADYSIYGDLFTWPVVDAYADYLCPSPWRVPTAQEYVDMAKVLSPVSNAFTTSTGGVKADDMNKFYLPGIVAAADPVWTAEGSLWKGRFNGLAANATAVGTQAAYWSATEVLTGNNPTGTTGAPGSSDIFTKAYSLYSGTNTNIAPAAFAAKNSGRALRCVKPAN